VYTITGAQTPVPEHDPSQVGNAADEHGTRSGRQLHEVGGKFSSGAQYIPVGQVPLQAAHVSPHGVAMDVEVVEVLLVVPSAVQ